MRSPCHTSVTRLRPLHKNRAAFNQCACVCLCVCVGVCISFRFDINHSVYNLNQTTKSCVLYGLVMMTISSFLWRCEGHIMITSAEGQQNCRKTSYSQIWWSLEAVRLVFRVNRSLWNSRDYLILPDTTAEPPVKCHSDTIMLRAISAVSRFYEISP